MALIVLKTRLYGPHVRESNILVYRRGTPEWFLGCGDYHEGYYWRGAKEIWPDGYEYPEKTFHQKLGVLT